eukprot:TRINITY_DN12005_c0_g1_i1.p1 TRINITY_DN12005_c0_g1~~TRINITY_DN12005_c0_g1_i1.p1  ORF type:complete len:486 (-),score=68.43 TRINITY_DN12005_c0_g1_i1:551-2008(-)
MSDQLLLLLAEDVIPELRAVSRAITLVAVLLVLHVILHFATIIPFSAVWSVVSQYFFLSNETSSDPNSDVSTFSFRTFTLVAVPTAIFVSSVLFRFLPSAVSRGTQSRLPHSSSWGETAGISTALRGDGPVDSWRTADDDFVPLSTTANAASHTAVRPPTEAAVPSASMGPDGCAQESEGGAAAEAMPDPAVLRSPVDGLRFRVTPAEMIVNIRQSLALCLSSPASGHWTASRVGKRPGDPTTSDPAASLGHIMSTARGTATVRVDVLLPTSDLAGVARMLSPSAATFERTIQSWDRDVVCARVVETLPPCDTLAAAVGQIQEVDGLPSARLESVSYRSGRVSYRRNTLPLLSQREWVPLDAVLDLRHRCTGLWTMLTAGRSVPPTALEEAPMESIGMYPRSVDHPDVPPSTSCTRGVINGGGFQLTTHPAVPGRMLLTIVVWSDAAGVVSSFPKRLLDSKTHSYVSDLVGVIRKTLGLPPPPVA